MSDLRQLTRAQMALRALIIAGLLAVPAAGSSVAPARAETSRVLWQGPALAGEAVMWSEGAQATGSLHVWTPRRGARVVYRSDSLAATRPFAASRTLLAFERVYPGCPPPSGHVCPDGADTVLGPQAGPFRILTGPRTCFLPGLGDTVALDGGIVAFVELDCARGRLRVVVRDVGRQGPPRVLREAPITEGCCRDIALAGNYVAWSERRDVVVYDRAARRVAYRARLGPAGTQANLDFDVQQDGKLAVAFRVMELGRAGSTAIGWLSREQPTLHLLPHRGRDTRVRIARDRIAFNRLLGGESSALVVADLRRRLATVARFAARTSLRDFDFDGRHIAWASERITARRVDCPPGPGRPCVRRLSGSTSIWRRALDARAPRLITRLRFEDAAPR